MHAHIKEQRTGHDVTGGLGVHAGGVDQVFLHVGSEGVENQRATGCVAKHGNERGLVIAQQRHDAAGVLVLAHFLAGGFFQRSTQEQRDQGCQRTDHERDAPAVGTQFIFAEKLLQDHDHQHCQQLPANQRHILERGEETALALEGDFAHVGGRGAVLAPH
ncbi:hypothetical protein D3C73_1120200 [compost metagenome]